MIQVKARPMLLGPEQVKILDFQKYSCKKCDHYNGLQQQQYLDLVGSQDYVELQLKIANYSERAIWTTLLDNGW